MALTSADETDLLIPLHDGTLGRGRFDAFLARLRQRTRAAHVSLLVRGGDQNAAHYHAGLDLAGEAHRRGRSAEGIDARMPLHELRPGRVYALEEFLAEDADGKAAYDATLGAIGLVDERVVRIHAGDDLEGWLVLARGEPCTASDSVLLGALVPHLAVALRSQAAADQADLAGRLAAAGLARVATGWIGLDREARVTALDPGAARWLERATGHAPQPGQRLRGLAAATERRWVNAVQALAAGEGPTSRAVRLSASPPIEALLRPGGDAAGAPAVLALCRFPDALAPASAEHLSELHGISRREAELAVLITEGITIAEAAARMGLTVETARNYSKQLYAKLGLRGQAELVRLVCGSGALLG